MPKHILPTAIVIGDNHEISRGYQFIADHCDVLIGLGYRRFLIESQYASGAETLKEAQEYFIEIERIRSLFGRHARVLDTSLTEEGYLYIAKDLFEEVVQPIL